VSWPRPSYVMPWVKFSLHYHQGWVEIGGGWVHRPLFYSRGGSVPLQRLPERVRLLGQIQVFQTSIYRSTHLQLLPQTLGRKMNESTKNIKRINLKLYFSLSQWPQSSLWVEMLLETQGGEAKKQNKILPNLGHQKKGSWKVCERP
jgi:hypothetical protein